MPQMKDVQSTLGWCVVGLPLTQSLINVIRFISSFWGAVRLSQVMATMKSTAIFVVILAISFGSFAQAPDPVIGELMGKPVHESDIKASEGRDRADELREHVVTPAIRDYLQPHEDEIALTEAEVKDITDSYNALIECRPELRLTKMEPPFDEMFAHMIGGNTKAQRFIYINNGRGRLLFQQAGMEAFDAMRNLVLDLERQGKFKFHHSTDRELALSYWTAQDDSGFLLPDPGSDKAFQLDLLMTKCP